MHGPENAEDNEADDVSRMMSQVLDTTIDMAQGVLVDRFNKTLYQFIGRLIHAYKTIDGTEDLRAQIKIQAAIVKSFRDKKATFLIENFYDMTNSHMREDDMDRDRFIINAVPKIEFLRPLCIHKYWPVTPDNTKANVWKYMQRLHAYSVDYHDSKNKKADMSDYAMRFLQTDQFQQMMKALTDGAKEAGGRRPN